jgi:colanic acid/amylovoran biosynthesis glycosyltransferase
MENKIIIYRDFLLPASETFIKAQAENLKKFTPYYIGTKRILNGLELPSSQVIVSSKSTENRNTINEIFFKKIGINFYLYNQIKKLQPKLIHAHFGPDGVLALPYAKKLNIPLIVTFHGYDSTTKDEFLLKQSFNVRNYVKKRDKLIKGGSLFIAVSNFIKTKLIEKGFPEEKIITHYIGVDVNHLVFDPSVKRENIVLFVGRLVENKGCKYLLQAMKRVQEKLPDVQLVIIGEGPEKEKLQKLAATTLQHVQFLGRQPYEEVIKWMRKAKVFSVPSLEVESGASEGLGMVFLEANALGLPVVSFKTGGIVEAIEHESTGLLAEPKNSEELANYIITLFQREDLWRTYSRNGVKRVQEKFNMKTQTNKLEEIYMSVIH